MNHCPRDREILASNDVHSYRYYSCEHCGGYWIPGGALRRALCARGIEELRSIPSAGASELQCPDCHTACDAMVIEGCKLDSCARCRGVWLDAGEVQRVKRLFPEGSAVVDADGSRTSKETQESLVAYSVVEGVGNLFLAFWG